MNLLVYWLLCSVFGHATYTTRLGHFLTCSQGLQKVHGKVRLKGKFILVPKKLKSILNFFVVFIFLELLEDPLCLGMEYQDWKGKRDIEFSGLHKSGCCFL